MIPRPGCPHCGRGKVHGTPLSECFRGLVLEDLDYNTEAIEALQEQGWEIDASLKDGMYAIIQSFDLYLKAIERSHDYENHLNTALQIVNIKTE